VTVLPGVDFKLVTQGGCKMDAKGLPQPSAIELDVMPKDLTPKTYPRAEGSLTLLMVDSIISHWAHVSDPVPNGTKAMR